MSKGSYAGLEILEAETLAPTTAEGRESHKFSGLDLLYLTEPQPHLQRSALPAQLGKTTGGSCDPNHSS